MGKILVINTLMGSLFVYRLSVLEDLSEVQLKSVDQIFRRFLWHGKKPKISLYTLTRSKEQGGLGLVDIRAKQSALKITWIFKLEKDPILAECAYRALNCHNRLRNLIWRSNMSPKDVKRWFEDSYWKQVAYAWSKIHYHDPQNKREVLNQLIWMNTNILIQGKPVFWKSWFDQDINFLEDVFNEDGTVKNLKVNWLELRTLKNVIPQGWKFLLENDVVADNSLDLYDQLSLANIQITKKVYRKLIEDKFAVAKYYDTCDNLNVEKEYEHFVNCIKNVLYSTNLTPKLKDFQYRLMLNKIITNVELKEWGIKTTDRCTLCDGERETIDHLLIECDEVVDLWIFIKSICRRNDIECKWDTISILWNQVHTNPEHVINQLVVMLKQYVYRAKCMGKNPSVFAFREEIFKTYDVEYYNAKRAMKSVKCIKKWSPIIKKQTN